ncbi:Proline dehydrogenase 1, mitochondrial [Gossypium arboreum]|uniref:Proline dehydrogenase 1, mitochondrial n=1 Tax=Gossypium arboreum TaxID=29729 RepID=A0A0B0N5U1_GOSAR|nr:Proline dehydrogenase 1, mitochondrial [Gossypium arboreum]
MPTSQMWSYCNHISMPLSQAGSYLHTYIGITYRCQRIKHDLTRTHISESYVMTYVS